LKTVLGGPAAMRYNITRMRRACDRLVLAGGALLAKNFQQYLQVSRTVIGHPL